MFNMTQMLRVTGSEMHLVGRKVRVIQTYVPFSTLVLNFLFFFLFCFLGALKDDPATLTQPRCAVLTHR